MKESMTAVAEKLFSDPKNKDKILTGIADVQLSATTMAKSVCAICECGKKLDSDMTRCKGFFIQLESFMTNPFMNVDINEISVEMAEFFCVDLVEMKIEVINLQNDIKLKSQKYLQLFWSLVKSDNYENLSPNSLENVSFVYTSVSQLFLYEYPEIKP
ncbi:unnamed protein product [Lepeophtheirus salmonis]|uniref:(salmon louse) hypothetical protein n=1 Tax=Lepeophtheirus salmonis TaxID=72036 RepID=A0A7R8CI35_LEPSM|nr:unnamed protein product [Lepeophtheirus salmonis]CAF2828183.1 unnamed protein product [Lepeophtheirus salmonis]